MAVLMPKRSIFINGFYYVLWNVQITHVGKIVLKKTLMISILYVSYTLYNVRIYSSKESLPTGLHGGVCTERVGLRPCRPLPERLGSP